MEPDNFTVAPSGGSKQLLSRSPQIRGPLSRLSAVRRRASQFLKVGREYSFAINCEPLLSFRCSRIAPACCAYPDRDVDAHKRHSGTSRRSPVCEIMAPSQGLREPKYLTKEHRYRHQQRNPCSTQGRTVLLTALRRSSLQLP